MKAYIKRNGDSQTVLRLEPENPAETEQIKKLAEDAGRDPWFSHSGYEYMSPVVSFIVTRQGSRD